MLKNDQTRVVAIEGTPLTGKSTLCSQIKNHYNDSDNDILLFPDYVEMLGDFNTPKFDPGSTESQYAAFSRFMDAEAARIAVSESNPPDIVLLDRSVDSLLAHSWALDQMYGYSSFEKAKNNLLNRAHFLPDITFLLFSDTALLAQRRDKREKTDRCDLFIQEDFIEHFRDFFNKGYCTAKKIVSIGSNEIGKNALSYFTDLIDNLLKEKND